MGKKTKITIFSILSVLSVVHIVANVLCFKVLGVDFINSALVGTGASSGDAESEKKGKELVKKVTEDSCVLLKNTNKALPLDVQQNNKVNVFGLTCVDDAWVFTGVGSGSCKPDPTKRVGLLQGLENSGIDYNKDLAQKYENYLKSKTNDRWASMNQYGKLMQVEDSFYTDDLIQNAKSYSDTAIIVLSRISGENTGEIPTKQVDAFTGEVDESRNYLQLSKKEEKMIQVVTDNFDKVIVLLNTTNNMQCDFLDNDKISAAMYVGPTGLNGTESIGNLLAGRKIEKTSDGGTREVKISPSGKLADTYSRDYKSEPGFANAYIRNKSNTGGNIAYQEDIYFGYKWYETAYEEGFFDGMTNGYNSAVMYPFGYGQSYTDFEWTIKDVNLKSGSELNKDSKIDVTVTVTNVGEYSGKDVVELYYKTPYYKGEIEKNAVTLGDFAKTANLKPGESQDLKLSLSAYDMASYDCYDKNNNGHTGYELDKGTYTLMFKSDAHKAKEISNGGSINYNISSTINYDKDPTTDYYVINRFTGIDAYANVPIDGSNVGLNCKYLSRSDFASTYTDRQIQLPTDNERLAKGRAYKTGAVDQEEMPTFGVDKGLYLVTKEDGTKATSSELSDRKNLKYNDELIDRLTSDYNSSLWDDLVSQASTSEVGALVEKSGFGSAAIESIGKPSTLDFDGPSGFNENTQKIAEDKSNWTSYPPECVIGCSWNVELANEIGKSMAFEASKSGINGWYAPGVNLHRSNFNGRNYEYYSEDPRISGKLASATITGAKSGGLYCYLKHFVVSEEGDNPKGVDTWLTEQNLRENYLKPFEMAVKSGANAIMTAFGRVGCVWAGANYDLLTEILRNEWGFKGSVVTDWSSGDDIMNCNRGVLAGNDLWLNPMNTNGTPLSDSNPTEMYAAKEALKHNIMTYISTYKYARDYDENNDEYKVDLTIKEKSLGTNWWIPTLITLDVIVFTATLAFGIYAFVHWNKIIKKKEEK